MSDSPEDIEQFLQWLSANGARFGQITWPSYETASGMRGAVANVDIEANDPIFYLPDKIIISPPKAFADPVIGKELKESESLLKGDMLITVYLMYEMSKGPESFWYPYFKILPKELDNLPFWNENQLFQLKSPILNNIAISRYMYFRVSVP